MQGGDDRGRRGVPLHGSGGDHDLRERPAPPDHGADVVEHRTGRRGDDADTSREGGERPLARRVEQTLGLEYLLQALELRMEDAGALRVDKIDDEVQITALLINGNASMGQHLLSVLQRHAHVLALEERATNLARAVFQREVDMAR